MCADAGFANGSYIRFRLFLCIKIQPFSPQRRAVKNPEENCEFSMLSNSLRAAVMTLPRRERELIESKFYSEKKLHELSDEFSISPSRISRIIKSGLDKVREELLKSEVV